MNATTRPGPVTIILFHSLPGGLVKAARNGMSGLGRTESEAYHALTRNIELVALRVAGADEAETLLMAEVRAAARRAEACVRRASRPTAAEFTLSVP